MSGRVPNEPLYVLPHGIEVIGEYAPSGKNRYWRMRIRPHRFFPYVRVTGGGMNVRRSRVLLASKLGRPLTPAEHAHHGDENRFNDSPDNIDVLTPAEHNRVHKTGSRHSAASKEKIGSSLKRAYAEGRRQRHVILKRDEFGRISR